MNFLKKYKHKPKNRGQILGKRKIKIRNLDLRDGHQSYFATRMTTKQIKEVLPYLIEAGYYGLEVWGGATLDSCIRYLYENPWERLKTIAEISKGKTNLTALARGINLFGYNPYPDEVVYEFNKLAVESGILIMRVFDALNDLNNLKTTIEAVKEAGGLVDCAICYTTNPSYKFIEKIKYFSKRKRFPKSIYNVNYFINKALELEKMGADMITIKDMAGLIHPKMAYELVKELKKKVKVPINLHSHCTPGYALTSHVAAMMAGVDQLDVASFPFSGGPSHPAVEIINEFAKRLNIDTGLNEEMFPKIRQKLLKIRSELSAFDNYKDCKSSFSGKFTDEQSILINGAIKFLNKKDFNNALRIIHTLEFLLGLPEPNEAVRLAQIPGGMYSNLLSQLEQGKISHLLNKVLKEVPKVRIDAGIVPLVTPTSQIVGVQAIKNVIAKKNGKEEYSSVTNQYKKLVKGEYGRTPDAITNSFRSEITGSKEEKRFDTSNWKHTEAPKELVKNKKDQMLLDLFPMVALLYLKHREEQKKIEEENFSKNKEFERLNTALSDNYLI